MLWQANWRIKVSLFITIIYGVTLLIILALNYSVGKTNKDIDEDARINLEKDLLEEKRREEEILV